MNALPGNKRISLALRFASLFFLWFLFAFTTKAFAGAGAPAPPVGAALSGLEFSEGWTNPHALPSPVNASGWQDSPFISADGRTLYFAYTRLDFTALANGQMLVNGPDRPGQHGVRFDIYEARIEGANWRVQNSTVNSPSDVAEGAAGVDEEQSMMVFTRFDRGRGRLRLARRGPEGWVQIGPVVPPLNSSCTDDNPTLSADGKTLWFDSSRSDPTRTSCLNDDPMKAPRRSIYQSHWVNGAWSVPQLMPGAPNQTRLHWQIFVTADGHDAYWAGSDTDCADGSPNSCLYHARLQPDGIWGRRTRVAQATPRRLAHPGEVFSIGEPSLTADGRFLYFVFVSNDAAGRVHLAIGVAEQSGMMPR